MGIFISEYLMIFSQSLDGGRRKMRYGVLDYYGKPEKVEWVPDELWSVGFEYFVRLTVDAAILDKDKICLVKRKEEPFKGSWHLPGGFVRKGESLIEAVERKAREETGLEVEVKDPVGVYELYDPRGHIVTIVWRCHPKAGKTKGNARYFRKDDLPRNIGFHHEKLIVDVLGGSDLHRQKN
jgi:8-oxo-dGTP diphosphatase